jgi:hypothetical protein
MPGVVGETGAATGAAGVAGFFFFKIGLTGGTGRRERVAPFAAAVSGFPQHGQNRITMSHSSQ